MTLETILISALLFTHLAIETQTLQTLRFDAISDCLRAIEFMFPHSNF